MEAEDDGTGPRKRRKLASPTASSYVLRDLLDNVPLESEASGSDVHITCVEYWNENLYIGTSAAEILHFVSLPPVGSGGSNEPSFILASRLPITFSQNVPTIGGSLGVRQIILLPASNRACILCNGAVSFYTLPELSPAFGAAKVGSCRWIGGLDLNRSPEESISEDPVIMVAVQNRIMLVKIGDELRRIRKIEFPGCLIGSRRGTIACVADHHSYSLVDVEHQQKIPLFPLSSSSEVSESAHQEDISPMPESLNRSVVSNKHPDPGKINGHERSTSLNTLAGTLGIRSQSPLRGHTKQHSSLTSDSFIATEPQRLPGSQERSGMVTSKDLPPVPADEPELDKQKLPLPAPKLGPIKLRPHILSPTPSEFLLITGTEKSEPGVGMFVNTDGDVVRGTVEFQRYPEAVVIDGLGEVGQIQSNRDAQEGYVLAVISFDEDGKARKCLEIQRWDIDPGEREQPKDLVDIPTTETAQSTYVGICHTVSPSQLNFHELGELLRIVRLKIPKTDARTPEENDPRTKATIEQLQKEKELFDSQETPDSEHSKSGHPEENWEAQRNKEEAIFAHGLGNIRSSLIIWSRDRIWRVFRNPLPLQLDKTLQEAHSYEETGGRISVNRGSVVNLTHSIQDVEPKTEAEFLGLECVRQKAGILLFIDLLLMSPGQQADAAIRSTEEILVASSLDPRIPLLCIPLLKDEVVQGPQGIWVHGGIAQIAELYLEHLAAVSKSPNQILGVSANDAILDMVNRYLFSWQRKRGYGSITDETFVFDSVDAALLHLLLQQDALALRESRPSSNARAELNRLADNWKGNFGRAVMLLEQYKRLFVLSRLYQSRKMAANVLRTWQRIVQGEKDDDNEINVSNVEVQMRKYLVKIRDQHLVEEYGSWLAARNPNLGIQVFADDNSRVRLKPLDVLDLLKAHAPNAVQEYLEHLVFEKNHTEFADDLIAYYLETVISVLQSSPTARAALSQSYSTYRALRPPKPSYLNFITESAPSEPWWQSRLRLLQLLGGGPSTQYTSFPSASTFSYSIPAVLARIEPFQNELVSESIILDGRQGRHHEALHLLTHGLGDYDSAIRYCLCRGPISVETGNEPSPTDESNTAKGQVELFRHLLSEFLQIEDQSDRIERTSDLLARFASWFDVREVLTLVPDDWSVEILSGFLVHVFRDLISEAREARIHRALNASLNLRVSVEYLEGVERIRGYVEDGEGLRELKGRLNILNRRQERHDNAGGNDDDEFGEIMAPGP